MIHARSAITMHVIPVIPPVYFGVLFWKVSEMMCYICHFGPQQLV